MLSICPVEGICSLFRVGGSSCRPVLWIACLAPWFLFELPIFEGPGFFDVFLKVFDSWIILFISTPSHWLPTAAQIYPWIIFFMSVNEVLQQQQEHALKVQLSSLPFLHRNHVLNRRLWEGPWFTKCLLTLRDLQMKNDSLLFCLPIIFYPSFSWALKFSVPCPMTVVSLADSPAPWTPSVHLPWSYRWRN